MHDERLGRDDAERGSERGLIDPSGIPHLDEILGGGIPRGALMLVVGPPGSGKTTLAAQIAFHTARSGQPVLILTALSEPTTKLIANLRNYRFFDPMLLGDLVQVVSINQFLDEGLAATVDKVVTDVRRRHASLVVLDGFSGLRGAARDAQEARHFLYDIGTRLGTLGVTTIITSEASPREPTLYPESTSADVLLGMHYALDDVRERRAIEATKVRGAAPLLGLHGLRLTEEGVTVYPRIEALVSAAGSIAEKDDEDEGGAGAHPLLEARAAFDLPALDALIEGGLTTRTPTLILGSPGVGKTLLGLQFAIAGVHAGERVVYLSFHETRSELRRKSAPFVWGSALRQALVQGGGITFLRQPAVERDVDVLADLLLRTVRATGARRVVIDSISVLERAVEETSGAVRTPNFLAALVESLRLLDVTTLLIRETNTLASPSIAVEAAWVSLLAANVIWLQQVIFRDRLYRVLSVPKMRFSAHDVTLREFKVAAPTGIQVLAPFESETGVLAGITRQQARVTRSS